MTCISFDTALATLGVAILLSTVTWILGELKHSSLITALLIHGDWCTVDMVRNKNKRKASQLSQDSASKDVRRNSFGLASTLAHVQKSELLSPQDGDDDAEEWITVGRDGKRLKTDNYPSLVYAELHQLRSCVKIKDLQDLALYCLADGTSPQWISVRHHFGIKKAVILFIPGLERGMFDGSIALEGPNGLDRPTASIANEEVQNSQQVEHGGHVASSIADHDVNLFERNLSSPDDYLPMRLVSEKLPLPLKPLADMFDHLWPIKAPGDDKYSKVYSPLHAMLNSPVPRSQKENQAGKDLKGARPINSKNWKNNRTKITEYIMSKEGLIENDYVPHPVWFESQEEKDSEYRRRAENKQTHDVGWKDTAVTSLADGDVPEVEIEAGSLTAGRSVLAMDCEMCMVEGDVFALTRISIVNWEGETVMDELVKPEEQINDYVTP